MLKRARPNGWVKIGTSLLVLGFMVGPIRPSVASSVTFTPRADSYVNQAYPKNNYGAATSLRTDASPAIYRSFLRFDVAAINGSITHATLRVHANSANSTGLTVAGLTDNSWDEKALNYANQPALGAPLGKTAPYGAGTWANLDVTPYVRANGTYS